MPWKDALSKPPASMSALFEQAIGISCRLSAVHIFIFTEQGKGDQHFAC